MNNQTQNFGSEPSLQLVILQSVDNPTAKENVSITATKCLGNICSDILVWLYCIFITFLAWFLFHKNFRCKKSVCESLHFNIVIQQILLIDNVEMQ